jgi:hypothetical protein
MFEDRRHAGRRLGARFAPSRATDPIVIGLPRGGVVVADEVARALEVTTSASRASIGSGLLRGTSRIRRWRDRAATLASLKPLCPNVIGSAPVSWQLTFARLLRSLIKY